MTRRPPIFGAIVLLALVAAVVALRIRARTTIDFIWFTNQHWSEDDAVLRQHQYGICTSDGRLFLRAQHMLATPDRPSRRAWHEFFPSERRLRYGYSKTTGHFDCYFPHLIHPSGFDFASRTHPNPRQQLPHVRDWTLVLHFWPLPILLTLPLIPRIYRFARHFRRSRRNQCLHCGYDLHATPSLCPECGATATP